MLLCKTFSDHSSIEYDFLRIYFSICSETIQYNTIDASCPCMLYKHTPPKAR
jgi:hypothetical protein